MPLRMPVVWSARHRGHATDGGYWLGVRLPGDEEPERGDVLHDDLLAAGATIVEPTEQDPTTLATIHQGDLLAYLASAHDDWLRAGHQDDPGQPFVVPYVWPLPQMRVRHAASAVRARAGAFAMDTMTLVGPHTWAAAVAAVEASLTAADLVAAGTPAAYAAVRPPGHHAGPAFFGGSCYLNNAAAAAQRLVERGHARVAVIDIDAHHGNGTQEIFWDRGDVLYASLHVDPGAGWFPHYAGFAEEAGAGAGLGANRNLPLPPGTGDGPWGTALAQLVDTVGAFGAEALVVSLGVDAAAADQESPLQVTPVGFTRAGALIASLRVPTVFVQEGGYDLTQLGPLVLAVLHSFEEARNDG